MGTTMAPSSGPDDELSYMRRLESRVAQFTAERPAASFLDVVRRCDGAYPNDVANVLRVHGPLIRGKHHCSTGREWDPELSPLRAEWYFAERTIRAVLPLLGDKVLAIGAPTVAEALSASGKSAALIDNSPWIGRRFDLEAVAWYHADLATVSVDGNFDTVVVDPPWYFPDMFAWLRKALSLVRDGGHVFMPLFGALTRPAAVSERNSILQLSEDYGAVEILPRFIEYETPLYEREALRASQLPLNCACPWRVADLIVVTKHVDADLGDLQWNSSNRSFGWLEFVVGGQIVSMLRASLKMDDAPINATPSIEPVPGVSDWVLDSVSARDARRRNVDIWTSRNRVARLSRPNALLRLISQLEQDASADLVRRRTELYDSRIAEEFLQWMEA